SNAMLRYGDTEICIDPSESVLHLLGKKYTMLIISVLGNGSTRQNFNDIRSSIPGISSTILSRRIKDLIDSGLVERRSGQITTYALTEKGMNVRNSLMPLLQYISVLDRNGD
uniref:possible HxlR family transcriptional factor n=1 Tax=Thermoplasma volcanium TaxID=50339 RepID=UPI00017BAF3E